MANKQISDLQARTFDGDSIIPHDVENTDPSTMSQKPYLTGSATGHAVADFVSNGEIYTTDLNTVDKHINGAINELHAINGYSYDAYDDTATYAVGDLCIYNNALYKCTTAITTAEAWNASHWMATSIADEIDELQSGLTHSTRVNKSYASGIARSGSGLTMTTYNKIVLVSGYLNTNQALTQDLTIANLGISLKEQVFATGYISGGSFVGIQLTSGGALKVQHSVANNAWLNFSVMAILAD